MEREDAKRKRVGGGDGCYFPADIRVKRGTVMRCMVKLLERAARPSGWRVVVKRFCLLSYLIGSCAACCLAWVNTRPDRFAGYYDDELWISPQDRMGQHRISGVCYGWPLQYGYAFDQPTFLNEDVIRAKARMLSQSHFVLNLIVGMVLVAASVIAVEYLVGVWRARCLCARRL